MFPRLSLIVTIDSLGGMSQRSSIPWSVREDQEFFRKQTTGRGKNALLFGRNTYESIPLEARPLKNRLNAVLSTTLRQSDNPAVNIYDSIGAALASLGARRDLDEIWVTGGEKLMAEILDDWIHVVDVIVVTRLKIHYDCDAFFPWDRVSRFRRSREDMTARDYTRMFLSPDVESPEVAYRSLLERVRKSGTSKRDRDGERIFLFAESLTLPMVDRFPLLTLRKVSFEAVVAELMFWLSGKTDSKVLTDAGIRGPWERDASRGALDVRGLRELDVGVLGPGIPHQLRAAGAASDPITGKPSEGGIDQLARCITLLSDTPLTTEAVLNFWNVSDLGKMALPPTLLSVQFSIDGGRHWLDGMATFRSLEIVRRLPIELGILGLLMKMIATLTNTRPRNLTLMIGEAYFFAEMGGGVDKLLERGMWPLPKLSLASPDTLLDIDRFTPESFILEGYASWPEIADLRR